MARVPSWTELRIDATKLAKLQRDCYYDVHRLLDCEIPELDKRLSALSGDNFKVGVNEIGFAREQPQIKNNRTSAKVSSTPVANQIPNRESFLTTINTVPIISNILSPTTYDSSTRNIKSRAETHKATSIVNKQHAGPTKVSQSIEVKPQPAPPNVQNIDDLEHLKPLPMPISEYLKMNRPKVVMRADRRVRYLKRESERRKDSAAAKIVNCLKQIRLSSPPVSRKRTLPRNYSAPDYKVKFQFSEPEMKRLTAKVYERLPEVKKQRMEELRNQLKIQNYKNRLEYGRKLSENRRQGILNHPLRATHDDASYGEAADEFQSLP